MLSVIGCVPGPKPPVPQNASPSASTPVAEINRMLASAAAVDRTSSADYHLGPEDMLQVTVFNLQGIDGGVTPKDIQVRVSQKGLIKLPLLGEIKVAGLSSAELEDLLRQRYEKFIRDPEIGVMVKEFRSQRVYLLGAINRAGAIDLTGPKTLIDVLAMAGGVNQRAGNQVHIYRETPDGRKSYVIDLFALASSVGLINDKTVQVVNLPVQPGDIINVPEAGMFFVDGAVRRAGSFPLGRRYTVTEALALAGGVDVDLADYSNVTIYRSIGNETKQIRIDLDAVRAGTEPDLAMQSDDFLFVPISGLKWVWNFYLKQAVSLPSLMPSMPAIAGS